MSYEIDERTYNAICDLAHTIHVVSKERIIGELEKLSSGKSSSASWTHLMRTGLWSALHNIEDDFDLPQLKDFEEFGASNLLAFYAFMAYWHQDHQQFDLLRYITNWPFSRSFKQELSSILHNFFILSGDKSFFKKALAFNSSQGPLALELWKFDLLKKQSALKDLDDFVQLFLVVCDKSGKLPAPLLQGKDLIDMGIKPSPEFQKILDKAYELQVMNKLLSKQEVLDRL